MSSKTDQTETINLNNVKIFRISDLIGGLSPKKSKSDDEQPVDSNGKKKTEKQRARRTRNPVKSQVMLEPSSFKISNRLAVHGNKPKKTKIHGNNDTDVLWLHNEKLKYFQYLQDEVLPRKKEELETCVDHKERLRLKEEIYRIESREEEVQYTLLTQDLIDRYNKMLETEDETHMQKDTSGNITKYIIKYDNIEKERITEEYCRLLNNGMMINSKNLKFDNSQCVECGGETSFNEGFVSCTVCGLASHKSVHDFRASYHDFQDTVVKSTFSYKRLNRFQEILSTLQAKENTEIPDCVMSAVQREIYKEQHIDISAIDTAKIKYYLKRLALNNYYEHAPHILNKINGIPPISIPLEVEEKLREMFKSIQEPFEIVKAKVCPKRLSFLSYNFVLYKFCELLSLDEYRNCFTLLKSIDKLRIQDKIWKGICEILEWEYIPSI